MSDVGVTVHAVQMTAPQLEFYAAEHAGRTAIFHTESGELAAWVVRDGDELRGRRGAWVSMPVATIPQVIQAVSERLAGRAPSEP